MPNSVGTAVDRVDGKAKVTGTARYTAEFPEEHLAYAVLVESTIGRGTVRSVDARDAMHLPGVLAVFSPDAPLRMAIPMEKKQSPQDRIVHAFQNRAVDYQRQPVALVVAETLEQATFGAALVRVNYSPSAPVTDFNALLPNAYPPMPDKSRPSDTRAGEPRSTPWATVDATYTTPFEHHSPMEPHATLAAWSGDSLLVYETTQGIFNARKRLAALVGLPVEKVRIVTKFLGGGFGCKGSSWAHTVLTVLAAREVRRPVKLVLERTQMFSKVGHRPNTRQHVVASAQRDGSLVLLRHEAVNSTSGFDEFSEPCTAVTRMLYQAECIETRQRLVRLSTGTPTFMRAPGEASGSFALESAMDELAYSLKMDPVQLRLRNYAERNPTDGKPFSSKSLRECYRVAAERFGWSRRTPEARSMRDGRTLIGWGMASASYPTNRGKASARARLLPDGTAEVVSGSQDIGTGTYTIMTQLAADALGLSVEQVRFDLGDTLMPETPVSGGSQTAASVGSAVKKAADALRKKAIALAVADSASPLFRADASHVSVSNGTLAHEGKSETYAALLSRRRGMELSAEAEAGPGGEKEAYAMHSFGAQFVEVRVDPDTCEVRIGRWVGAYGVGQVLNEKTARSQLLGAITFGIGMALMEESVMDTRTARFMTQDLADYHVPVNPDVPTPDVTFVPETDSVVNEIGVKGIGELGITGAAAAVANAVFHATGTRVRQLPITPDKLLRGAAPSSAALRGA
jgi:xanthine dehydrogenase YagR molybdenum-binding subunit